MNEQNRQATDLSRRRFLTNTVAGLAAASAVRERTSLPATIKVVKAARTAKKLRKAAATGRSSRPTVRKRGSGWFSLSWQIFAFQEFEKGFIQVAKLI